MIIILFWLFHIPCQYPCFFQPAVEYLLHDIPFHYCRYLRFVELLYKLCIKGPPHMWRGEVNSKDPIYTTLGSGHLHPGHPYVLCSTAECYTCTTYSTVVRGVAWQDGRVGYIKYPILYLRAEHYTIRTTEPISLLELRLPAI